jgi:peptide/nickel transport system permease protein
MTGVESRPAAVAAPVARRRRVRWSLVAALVWAGLVVILAVFADVLPIPGYDQPVSGAATPPFQNWPEFLGTDDIGRSVLARVIYGTRVSLTVSVIATAVGLGIGTLAGLAAAYFRGPVAAVIGLVSDVMLAFPVLVLLLAVAAVIRPSMISLAVLLGVISVPACQRIAGANARAQLGRDYILAARELGVPGPRLLLREVLPNIVNSLIAFGFLLVAFFMVFEGALDFLGVGVPPPRPSWGAMIAAGVPNIQTEAYIVFVPATVLFITVFAFNTISDRLRERLDERWTQL